MNGTTASATAYRYITRHPGVRSGHAIVEGTRIGVHDVVGLFDHDVPDDLSFAAITRLVGVMPVQHRSAGRGILDDTGRVVEVHEKYPVDKGHQKV